MTRQILLTLTLCLGVINHVHADSKDSVSVAAPWEISSTDPATDGYIFLRMGVMETLVDTDENGALVPGLASRWVASEDGMTWTFRLRNARFHDESMLTADVVVAALERAFTKPGPLSKAPVGSIVENNGSVTIQLTSAYAILPAILAHSSTVIPAAAAFDSEGNALAAIGTGPFKVDELTLPQSLNVSRFEDYWGTPSVLGKASYLATKRAETRALMAESGDADLVFTLDPSGFKSLGTVDTVSTEAVAFPV